MSEEEPTSELKMLDIRETQDVLASLTEGVQRIEASLYINRHKTPVPGYFEVHNNRNVYFWNRKDSKPEFIMRIAYIISEDFTHLVVDTESSPL